MILNSTYNQRHVYLRRFVVLKNSMFYNISVRYFWFKWLHVKHECMTKLLHLSLVPGAYEWMIKMIKMTLS